MARTYSHIAYLDVVDDFVSFLCIINVVIQVDKAAACPSIMLIEFIHHGAFYRFVAHIHRDEAWSKHGTVFVTVDFSNIRPSTDALINVLVSSCMPSSPSLEKL